MLKFWKGTVAWARVQGISPKALTTKLIQLHSAIAIFTIFNQSSEWADPRKGNQLFSVATFPNFYFGLSYHISLDFFFFSFVSLHNNLIITIKTFKVEKLRGYVRTHQCLNKHSLFPSTSETRILMLFSFFLFLS